MPDAQLATRFRRPYAEIALRPRYHDGAMIAAMNSVKA